MSGVSTCLENTLRNGVQVRVYTNASRFLFIYRAVQPAIGVELMRILSPEVFIAVVPCPITCLKCVYVTTEPTG